MAEDKESESNFDLSALQAILSSSSTAWRSVRLESISEELRYRESSDADTSIILDLLFDTCPRYRDRRSRKAVRECLKNILNNSLNPHDFSPFINRLKDEVGKAGIAPSSAFVLVEWCAALLQECATSSALWDKWALELLLVNAQAIDISIASESRESVRRSALNKIRRALLVSLSTHPDIIKILVPKLVATDKSFPAQRNAIFLGLLAQVCVSLLPVRDSFGRAPSVIEDLKSSCYAFYVREIVGSRTAVPPRVSKAFADFFCYLSTIDELKREVVPAVEKALLRSPEIVLQGVIPALLGSLPPMLDLSEILQTRLLKPLLSNIRSTDVSVRNGALLAFKLAARRSTDDDILFSITNDILNHLRSQRTSPEERVLLAQMLIAVPPSSNLYQLVSSGLCPLVTKEASDMALDAETLVLQRYFLYGLVNGTLTEKSIMAAFIRGLSDKKPLVRRIWALRIGELLWQSSSAMIKSDEMLDFIKAIIPPLRTIWTEITSSALGAVSNGLITAAYIIFVISQTTLIDLREAGLLVKDELLDVSSQMFVSDHRQSFLLNHRIYTKLHLEEDLNWFLRALSPHVSGLIQANHEHDDLRPWGQAFMYLITSSVTQASICRRARHTLSAAYVEHPELVSSTIVEGLWKWRQNIDLAEKDSAAMLSKTGIDRIYLVINSICYSTRSHKKHETKLDMRVLEKQLVELAILCRPQVFPRTNWIGTCQKMKIDPGDLVLKYSTLLLDNIVEITKETKIHSNKVRDAAYAAAAEFAFVAPDVFTDLLVRQIKIDLNPERLGQLGPEEAAIYRTPEGTAFVDVLAQQHQNQNLFKNSRDHDILKWETELREQLAQKSGERRELNKEEQARVNVQIAKESDLRARLQEAVVHLERGYGIIRSLGLGPPTKSEYWMWPAVTSILTSISCGSGLLMGLAPSEAYLVCSAKVTPRLGALAAFIGSATLRRLPLVQVPQEYEEEPFGDQVSRVLYRLRLTGEQRPLDTVSALYTLPLIFSILRDGGIGNSQEDADVQVMLALEFLALHLQLFANERFPRQETLSVLIGSMQKYTSQYKTIRECILGLCKYVSLNMTGTELKVLLGGVIVPEPAVRTAVLQAIDEELELTEYTFLEELWLASYDDLEENAETARTIWAANDLGLKEDSPPKLLPYLESTDKQLRNSAACALAAAIRLRPSSLDQVLGELQTIYKNSKQPVFPHQDPYGRQKKQEADNAWTSRSGVAMALQELADILQAQHIGIFLNFLLAEGPARDTNATVRKQMIKAAKSVIAISGHQVLEELMQTFESSLEALDKDSEGEDPVKEAIIILYGALARHLEAGDSRLPKVMRRLMGALETPSEAVQYAVAECLPPLVRASINDVPEYINDSLEKLLGSKTYAARRGGAYGLAGIVLGRGISALREHRIIWRLQSSLEEKRNPQRRQGVMFAYELLSFFLGKMFEPYTIQIVPQLLATFGDSDTSVRDACLDTAKTCFASLTSYGVKLILPPLLEGLEDTQWRSKKGACDLLGAMAYLDPQQLAQSLPDIIPPLTDVLNDSHKEVRASAKRSLQRFGDVISNPEMQSVVGVLLKAISDPIKHTDDALDSLIKVSFVHYLDAPSLALVVRILERGLGDRSATRRKSAQIIGSLAHLTERKDLLVHLQTLVGGLRVAILDPVPTTRATASKALGSLIEKLGEESLPDLVPSLMSTLKSESGAGDRLGSAQALSEVLAGLGTSRLEETLPTILQNATSPQPSIREGFMTLFIFLPACFGNSFALYLNRVVPPVLSGLADEVESIRDTSLRAGRLLVRSYATRAVDLLLPELEQGLADDSYRIRLSSVELVGDLLFTLTGKSGNVEHDEAEEEAGDTSQSLIEVLGEEKRARVLSLLYICRCDTSILVRNAAIGVWKVMVASPRVLKELVPTLTRVLIRRLASSNMEHKVIAGNALGELIRKAGGGLMSTLLPMLEEGLNSSTDPDAKQGVCIALRELIASAPPEALQEHDKVLIFIVRTALVDDHQEVRESAAEAYDSIQRIFGKRAIDQILPHILNLLRQPSDAENALAALLTLLTDNARSNFILPNLLPTLLTPPISAFNAKALASLSQVAGPSLTRRMPQILNGIIENAICCNDDTLQADLNGSFDTILLSVDEFDGLNTAMSTMLALSKNDDHQKRAATDYRLAKFFADADVDFSRYHQDLIRVLLISFDDRDPEVVKAAWTALSALVSRLKKEEMETLVISTRQVLQGIGVPGVNLPGFCLLKGIGAILPIFLQGLINGTSEQRTQSALAISDIVDRTSAEALRPYVTQIAGPLIRVVSERSADVRAAVLLTLDNLLEKIPTFLKPFLPQLQRTFAKSLADTTSEMLRARAAKALGTLVALTPRVDPLISELVTGSKATDPGVRNAMLKALYVVVSKAGKSMSEASRSSIFSLIDINFNDSEDDILVTRARLLGVLIKYLPDAALKTVVKSRVVVTPPTSVSILCINAILAESSEALVERYLSDTATIIRQGIASNNSAISDNSVLAAGKFLLIEAAAKPFDLTKSVVEALASVIAPENLPDTRRLALVVVRTISRAHPDLIRPYLSVLAPPIFASVRDTIVPVKIAAEAAFLSIFAVADSEGAVFEKYLNGTGASLPPNVKNNMQDYFKRVTLRRSNQLRDGQAASRPSNDEQEDEQEVWSVGKVDLGYFGEE